MFFQGFQGRDRLLHVFVVEAHCDCLKGSILGMGDSLFKNSLIFSQSEAPGNSDEALEKLRTTLCTYVHETVDRLGGWTGLISMHKLKPSRRYFRARKQSMVKVL